MDEVFVVGAGLAGCEVAWQLSRYDVLVTLFEMKPKKFSPAHKSENFAELVCSNSFKSKDLNSACGMLKKEMEILGSLTLEVAKNTEVDAGRSLAVDRTLFSKEITEKILANRKIKVVREEITKIPKGVVVFATGPLTSKDLILELQKKLGVLKLHFFDAIAPIVFANSIDYESAFFGSRYEPEKKDYLNCPMNKDEYEDFYESLITAKTVALHSFDKPKVYEGCMPIEIMAKRGKDTIRFGPLKPVGLFNPKTNKKDYAIVQLRKENLKADFFNMVGFQTNLTFPEQTRVFRKIPALKNAEFLRFGTMHKNTFINSPSVLTKNLCLKNDENIFFAGQITGVEGYLESAATGILVGKILGEKLTKNRQFSLPKTSIIASLVDYITNEANEKNFQPMAANFGLLPLLGENIKNKKEKRQAITKRGILDLLNSIKDQKI